MERITLTIATGGAAFADSADGYEAGRILRELAARLEDGEDVDGTSLRDYNGNTVGRVVVEDGDELRTGVERLGPGPWRYGDDLHPEDVADAVPVLSSVVNRGAGYPIVFARNGDDAVAVAEALTTAWRLGL